MATERNENNSAKPLVSIILPAFNEEKIIQMNITRLYAYLKTLDEHYSWEVLVVNDGSEDQTGFLAEEMAKSHTDMMVFHHKTNRNLGTALRTGFGNSNGDYVVVLDIDLSYAPHHIEGLLTKLRALEAEMVIASPYMKGGKSTAVPRLRLLLSKTVNFIMRKVSRLDIYTFTGMVRAYNGDFIRSLNTKSSTFDINSEIILKAYILRGKIVEIPGHLDWSEQKDPQRTRTSSIQIVKGIFNGLVNSFMFRPYMFFWVLGAIIFLLSFNIIAWIGIHTYYEYPMTADFSQNFEGRFSLAVSEVFRKRPYSFIVGGTTLIIAIQLLGLGFISLQKKRYFDELFHLNSALLRASKK